MAPPHYVQLYDVNEQLTHSHAEQDDDRSGYRDNGQTAKHCEECK